MKISFRRTLLLILLFLSAATVLGVGMVSYWHARVTANDLAAQMLRQIQARIDLEVDGLLQQATKLSTASEHRLRSGRLRPHDFTGLIGYLQDTMQITNGVTGYFVGLETGEAAGITRLSGRPSIWQSQRNSQNGRLEVHEYWPEDYPRKPCAVGAANPSADIRLRPWYIQAKQSQRPGWTESFVFLGVEGKRNVLGVTHATPVYADGNHLLAVLDADFELEQLCRFVQTLDLGEGGLAFVIERRRDGSRRVIAHPQPEKLLHAATDGRQTPTLIAPEDFPDARVRAFAAEPLGAEMPEPQEASWPARFLIDHAAYIGTFHRLDPRTSPPWTICVVLPEEQILGLVHRSIRIMLLVGATILALAIGLSWYFSGQVARPLEALADEARAIGNMQFQARPAVHSTVREVDQLATAMEDMKGGLRSFEKFVPADLVRSLLSARREASFGGERRTVTLFFSDIADFTTIAEQLRPETLVERLREYLNVLSQEIVAAGGTVDKYLGDGVMAFWGAPAAQPHHAAAACTGALRCQAALRVLSEQWQVQGTTLFHTRFGLHTGEVVVGNIGSDARLNYTAIGDAVNLASRMEALNKLYGTQILISESTYQAAGTAVLARAVDCVSVKGKTEPIVIYELLGLPSAAHDKLRALAAACAGALACYRQRDWDGAIRGYEEALSLRPGDRPATVMLTRCRDYRIRPPAGDWDGVYRLETK